MLVSEMYWWRSTQYDFTHNTAIINQYLAKTYILTTNMWKSTFLQHNSNPNNVFISIHTWVIQGCPYPISQILYLPISHIQIFYPQYPISQICNPPISHIPDFTVNLVVPWYMIFDFLGGVISDNWFVLGSDIWFFKRDIWFFVNASYLIFDFLGGLISYRVPPPTPPPPIMYVCTP